VSILLDRGTPPQTLKLFARRRSTIVSRNTVFEVKPLDVGELIRCDVVFLVANADVARRLVPLLLEAGVATVDN
jgi:aspartate-semialdehyde dehydrogenase